MPKLSVIIVNVDTCDLLSACLHSLSSQDVDGGFEVVVVENASSDGSAEMVRERFPQFSLHVLATRVGFGEANNAGALGSSGEFMVLLNPDTVVGSGALHEIVSWMSDHPRCGIAGGRIVDGRGTLEQSKGSFPTLTSLTYGRLCAAVPVLRPWAGRRANQHWVGYELAHQVDWVTGAYLWIRREVFEAVGGFDPGLFMYAEDTELAYRVSQLGWECWYVPQGSITHYRGQSPTSRSRSKMRRESLAYFAEKHYGYGTKLLTRLAFKLGAHL